MYLELLFLELKSRVSCGNINTLTNNYWGFSNYPLFYLKVWDAVHYHILWILQKIR